MQNIMRQSTNSFGGATMIQICGCVITKRNNHENDYALSRIPCKHVCSAIQQKILTSWLSMCVQRVRWATFAGLSDAFAENEEQFLTASFYRAFALPTKHGFCGVVRDMNFSQLNRRNFSEDKNLEIVLDLMSAAVFWFRRNNALDCACHYRRAF